MTKRFCRFFLVVIAAFMFQKAAAQTDTASAPVNDAALSISVTDSAVSFYDPTVYPKITYGIRAGMNFATLRYNGGNLKTREELETDRSHHIRLQAGLAVNVALNNSLSIQPELLYTQKGIKNKGATTFTGKNANLEAYKRQLILNYIEVPVLVKVASPVYADSLRFFFNAGPSVGFLLNGKDKLKTVNAETEEKITFSPENSTDMRPEYKRLDASIHAGAGFELLTRLGRITLEGRYIYGLSNVINFRDATVAQPKAYNRSAGLYLTYFLPHLK